MCNVAVGVTGGVSGGQIGFERVGDGLGGVEAAEAERAAAAVRRENSDVVLSV